MKKNLPTQLPPRCRPVLRTRFHYWLWTIIILVLWPAALLMRGLEKLCRHG